MFRQVKSPAYGTGIATNLVSNEERQKYNYGGRVGLLNGSYLMNNHPADDYHLYSDKGVNYASPFVPKTYEDFQKLQQMEWQYPQSVEDIETAVAEHGEVKKSIPWQGLDFNYGGEDSLQQQFQRSPEGKDLYRKKLMKKRDDLIKERESVGLYTPGETSHPSKGIDARWSTPIRGKEEVVESDTETFEDEFGNLHQRTKPKVTEQKKTVHDDSMWNRKQNTDDLDTDADGWATLMGELDKDIEKKKQLGKGNALMKAAAAAVKWGGAPTAEKRSAAISEGLTSVGETAMKAAAEGMDLKNRAKILKGIEDVKNEKAIEIQEMKGEQAMGRVKERIAFTESQLKAQNIEPTFKNTFLQSLDGLAGKPSEQVTILSEIASKKNRVVNVLTVDMSSAENLAKKHAAGSIIRDSKPGGHWYLVDKDGEIIRDPKTHVEIAEWVESQPTN